MKTGPRTPGSRGLSSNGLVLDDALVAPMRDSTDLLDAPGQLRARLVADGYLLLRGVLEREQVLDVRRDYFGQFPPGLLAPGTSAVEGVFSGSSPAGLPPYGTEGHPAHAFVRGSHFDTFTRNPVLTSLASTLLGGEVLMRERRILRHFDNAAPLASRAHVDRDYMDQGTDQILTMWLPMGDCPVDCGGLVYLSGSKQADPASLDALRQVTDRPHDRRPVSHDLGLVARQLGGRWLATTFEAGDVAVHTPRLVHASLDNRSPVMRLSIDLRFQLAGAPADPRWDTPWAADDGA